MKAYKGESPITIRFRRKSITNRPDLCRLMADVYIRETQKRFYFNLPGYFIPQELDKLDTQGRIKDPRDYNDKALIHTSSRIFDWQLIAATAFSALERSGVAVKDFTKKEMDAAIKAAQRKEGEI